jgi:anti-anti-sigma factor
VKADVPATSPTDLIRGDHACLVCATDAERWRLVSDYVRSGLRSGERTMYVVADHSERQVRRRLNTEGGGGGELIVVPAALAHGYGYAGSEFDCEATLDAWADRARAARADGFSGLRVVVDMTWLEQVDVTLDALVGYERRITELVDELSATALCVYDSRRFHAHTLARATYSHPLRLGAVVAQKIVLDSRYLSVSTAGPGALALAGEVDGSNAEALTDVLTTAIDGGDALLLDMRALRFIDVAGMRAIHDVGRRLCNGEVVLVAPPPMVRRMLPVLGIDVGFTLDE